jgi:hypothetical protein
LHAQQACAREPLFGQAPQERPAPEETARRLVFQRLPAISKGAKIFDRIQTDLLHGLSQGRPSFLKKRSKRLLLLRQLHVAGHGLDRGSGAEAKVFWFFSSEKNTLPLT